MHEAGIAQAVAIAIERHQKPWASVRVALVEPEWSFDATADAVRVHVAALLDGFDVRRLEVVPARVTRLCSACGSEFESNGHETACPTCGGPPMPFRTRGPVSIEFLAVGT